MFGGVFCIYFQYHVEKMISLRTDLMPSTKALREAGEVSRRTKIETGTAMSCLAFQPGTLLYIFKHQVLPEFLACQPAVWVLNLPAPTVSRTNSFKKTTLSLSQFLPLSSFTLSTLFFSSSLPILFHQRSLSNVEPNLGPPGWSHLKMVDWVTSAKTLYPNKATFTSSRDLMWISFGVGGHFSAYHNYPVN